MSIDILRQTPTAKSPFLPSQFTNKTWTALRPNVREVVEYETSNSKAHGLTSVKKNETQGILCDDKQWKICDSKAVSLTYLSLGTEGRLIFGSQEPTVQIDQISTKDLWETLNNVFTKHRNLTFDRYTFLTRKQLQGEPVEKFYGCLRELFLSCDLGCHEESIIRDVFIANM